MFKHFTHLSILFYPITLEGHRGTTDEFTTIPFHLVLFSAALVELAKTISRLLFDIVFPPLLLFPSTVPCRNVFAKPADLKTWLNYLSFGFLTRVRSSPYSPMLGPFCELPYWKHGPCSKCSKASGSISPQRPVFFS